jgi:hypothetical protein
MSKFEKDMVEATERLQKALTARVAASLTKADLADYLTSEGSTMFGVEVVDDSAITDNRVFRAARITFPWDTVTKSLSVRESCPRCGYMKEENSVCSCVSSATKVNWTKE